MKKFVNADSAYEIMDKLFAKIQKNGYVATQQMFDEAWNEWTKVPNAFNVFEVTTRLKSCADENMKISYKDALEIITDEEQNGDSRVCKFCGKSRKEETIFPVKLNGERIYTCQDCISKQTGIRSIGFDYPLKELDSKADKKIELYVHFLNPDLFGNASYAKVCYSYENEIELKHWQMITRVSFIANVLGLEEKEVFDILSKGDESDEQFSKCYEIYKTIEFCSKEEYENND